MPLKSTSQFENNVNDMIRTTNKDIYVEKNIRTKKYESSWWEKFYLIEDFFLVINQVGASSKKNIYNWGDFFI